MAVYIDIGVRAEKGERERLAAWGVAKRRG